MKEMFISLYSDFVSALYEKSDDLCDYINLLLQNDENIYVKESAVSALGMIGDEKAVDSLVSILESTKGFISKFTFLKERALEALNKMNFRGDKVLDEYY